MYVKKSLNHLILFNLNALEDEYETCGLKSSLVLKVKIFAVVLIDIQIWMPVSLSIIWNQPYPKLKTKIICVMGDFNLNLLSYETHTHTNDFVNSMVFQCLIPHILQPTKVTDHSATVIDNIFSNVTDYETASGNILNQVADHYSQFLILKKVPAIHKDSSYYTYDYSNFYKDSLLDDF